MQSGNPISLLIRQLNSEELPDILPLVSLLNPSLSPETLAKRLKQMMQCENYYCAGGFFKDKLIAAGGYWIATKFYCGRYLELDNVIVAPNYRSHGIGKQLIAWLEAEGQRQHCEVVMLDAYTTNTRARAFYETAGYKILGHHFLKTI